MLDKSTVSNKTLLHLALIVLLGLLIYSNTFNVPFVFDDEPNIRDNPLIKDFIYFEEPSKAAEVRTGYSEWFSNRIVGYLTFAVNYRVHGLDVRGYHAVNLAIHIANALLVYWLVLLTFMTPFARESSMRDNARIIALFSGVLFISHPVNTQAVTYTVQRFASLAALFYLLSLTLYIKCRLSGTLSPKSISLYMLALLSAVLAMKTKEIAFTLPIVVALYELMFFRGSMRKRLLYLIPILMTMLIIPIALLGANLSLKAVMGEFREATRLYTDVTRSDYLFTQFRVISTYIRLLLLPVNQNLDYDYPVFHSFFSTQVFFSFLLVVSLLALAIFLLRKSRTDDPALRVMSFGIFWFFLTLSIESSIIPIVDVIFEHRTYLPNAGIILAAVTAVTVLAKRISKVTTAAIMYGIIVVMLFSSATYARNSVWESKRGIWEDIVEKSPEKWRGHYNLGNEYQEAGLFGKAVVQYKEAIILDPEDAKAYYNLGNSYKRLGLDNMAVEQYRLSLKKNPEQARAYNNIGNIYLSKKMYDQAIEQYRQAIKIEPGYADVHYNTGIAYYFKGDLGRAIEHYSAALAISPNDAEVHYNLGIAYADLGEKDKARGEFRKALRINPNLLEARRSLKSLDASEEGEGVKR